METLKTRRAWSDVFQELNENNSIHPNNYLKYMKQ
jgi:hypothetical protein